MQVFVEVNDKILWTLRPFAHLFNTYWSSLQHVTVLGYSYPDFRLPANFSFYQISPLNYPAEMWSNGIIQSLLHFQDSHFVFLLSDYWMIRTVDCRGVAACYDYIESRNNVLRIDLTDDRQYNGDMFDVDLWGSYDIIETPYESPYQMSTQAGIWNRALMLSLLKPGKTAWDVEIGTRPPPEMRVLGTRQRPVRYANALKQGKLDWEQINKVPTDQRNTVLSMIPERLK